MTQMVGSGDTRDPETYAIIGAAMEVHRTLGPGFLEVVYQRALTIEFDLQKLPYQRESDIHVYYKQTPLGVGFRADFVCFQRVLVELKALPRLTGTEEAQVINYLVASRLPRAILLNFGTPSLQFKRFAGGLMRPQISQMAQIPPDGSSVKSE
jgi:GxxExxY protein